LVTALRPQTPKHIRGGWSHYTNTSEPAVDGNGAHNMVTVQSGFRTSEPVHGKKAQNMVTVQPGFKLATFRSLAHRSMMKVPTNNVVM
jgi:predicted cupin superfamily sugar epimerase